MGFSGTSGDQSLVDLIVRLKAVGYCQDLFTYAYGSNEITEAKIQNALAQFVIGLVAVSDFLVVRKHGDKKTSLVHLAGAIVAFAYGAQPEVTLDNKTLISAGFKDNKVYFFDLDKMLHVFER